MNILSNFFENLPTLLLSLPIVLFALSVHETAHGYVAYKLGDPTAHDLGRLTLNPLKHLDPLGFLCMVLFRFGWARPVPVMTRYFKKPRRDMALVGIAGPISNLLLGVLSAVLLRLVIEVAPEVYVPESRLLVFVQMLVDFLYLSCVLNINLAVFYLLPIPPFDGSRFFYVFLPTNLYFKVMQYERFTGIAIMIIIFILSRIGLNPISIVVYFILNNTMDLLVLIANAFLNLIL